MRGPVIGCMLVFVSGPADAQIRADDATDAVQAARFRYSVAAGAGVEGFVSSQLRSVVASGPAWNVRAAIGNPKSIRVEASYQGSTQTVDATDGARLSGNGVVGSMRINVYPDAGFEPFFYFGAGWSRYSVHGRTVASRLPRHDDVLEMPFGIGLAYRIGPVMVEARSGITIGAGADLLRDPMPQGSEQSFSEHRFGSMLYVGYSM